MSRKSIRFCSVVVGLAILLSSCTPGAPAETTAPTLEPWRVCAAEGAEAVLSALKIPSFETINFLSEGEYTIRHFTEPSCDNSLKLFTRTFGELEWSIGEATIDADSLISVEVELTYADYKSAVDTVFSDPEKMTEIHRPIVLHSVNLMELPEADDEYLTRYSDYIMAEMDKNPKTVTSTGTVVLKYNADLNTWTLASVPKLFRTFEWFYGQVDPMFNDSFENSEEFEFYMIAAAEKLYEEDQIDYESYYWVYDTFCERAVIDIEEVKDRMSGFGWADYETQQEVTHYKAGTPEFAFVIDFFVPLPGLMLFYEYYKVGKKDTLYEWSVIMTGRTGTYLTYWPEGGLKKGEYRIIVRVVDGSVLVEDTITVK